MISKCLFCLKLFENPKSYMNHLSSHKNQNQNKFKCYICDSIFKNYFSFKSHNFRYHRAKCVSLTNHIQCKFCELNFITFNKFIQHTKLHFANNPQGVDCPINLCSAFFKNFNSFKSHFFRKHNSSIECLNSNNNITTSVNNCVLTEDNQINYNNNQNPVVDIVVNDVVQVQPNDLNLTKDLGHLFLKMKSVNGISESVIGTVLSEVKNIVLKNNEKIRTNIQEIVSSNSVSPVIQNQLQNVIPSFDSFSQISSTYSRTNYYKKNFNYVPPQEISLGNNNMHTDCKYHYIPLLDNLKSLLEQEKCLEQVIGRNLINRNDDIFENYTDGEFFKNHQFFGNNENNLEIIIFQDGFEICNPLLSSRGKHKMLGVYMTIGNLKPHHRSLMKNIHLVLLCKEKYVREFGIDIVLEPLIRDFKVLETEGLIINTRGFGSIIIKGSIIIVAADSLGGHQIGGFMENFSTTEFLCRVCYFTRTDLLNKFVDPKELRTIANYNFDADNALVLGEPYHGVKMSSCLNKLQHYHVCQPGLPFCLAHDLFEGIVQYDLMYMLKYFISKNYLNINLLNLKIVKIMRIIDSSISFPLFSIKNKKLNGTAHQNWIFVIAIPLLMKQCPIDQDDDVWMMFLSLLEICRLTCCRRITKTQISRLNGYIEEYIAYRVRCFPEINLRPKHHYLTHYPHFMRLYGPLIHLSTLRFEQKHQYFKLIANRCKNYKNITKILSERHQLNESLENDRYPSDLTINSIEKSFPSMISIPFDSTNIIFTKSITYKGILYKQNACVVYKIDEFYNVETLQIEMILVNENSNMISFFGKIAKFFYNYKTGIYENVSNFEEIKIINFEEIIDENPFFLFHFQSKMYFSLKYSIV